MVPSATRSLVTAIVVFLMVSSALSCAAPVASEGVLVPPHVDQDADGRGGSRVIVDKFDNGSTTWTYTFHTDQVWKGATFTLNDNAIVDDASMLVRGLPYTANTKLYPEDIDIDFGDDGDIEWSFMYPGAGRMGWQYQLANETLSNDFTVSASVENTDTSVRLPKNATITNATLNIEGCHKFDEGLVVNGTEQNEYLGWSVAFVGDLNGDNYEDFAIGSPKNDTATGSDVGKVEVFFGGPGLDDTPDLTMYGEGNDHEFGWKVAPAGDVNNDNYDDLVVGAPLYDEVFDNRGAAYVYYGGDPMDTTPDVIMKGEALGNWFGRGVTGVGDLNDDGYDDIVSAGPNWGIQTGPEDFDRYGKLYVYLGGDPMDNVSDLSVQGWNINQPWGHQLSPAGDFNDDGYADFLVGTYNHAGGCSDCGKWDLFLGGAVLDGTVDLTVYGTNGEEMGWSLAPLGDINKDGYDDIIVGAVTNKAHGLQTGAAYVYLGGNPFNGNADLVLTGMDRGDWFGSSVSAGGDINNDGWLDILVGSEMNATQHGDSGAVFVFFGGATLDNDTDVILPGLHDDDRFGTSLSGGIDYNSDGHYDMLVGASRNDSKATDGGRTYLFLTAPRRATDPVLDLAGPSDPAGDLWNHTGIFIDNVTISDFKASLNQYLQTAQVTGSDIYGNEYVDISFGVTSTYDAEFIISNISIFYTYDAVVGINPWTGTLRKELDDKLPHTDTGNTTIPVKVRSRIRGKVMMHGLQVELDEGPVIEAPFLPVSMDEDTLAPHLMDLYDHFDDDLDPDDFLSYEIVSFTNPDYVNVTLNGSHFVSVDALNGDLNDNWTGSTVISVNATDTRGLTKGSGLFTVSIIEVNDAPVITSDPVLTATATRPYSYQVTADDDNGPIAFSLSTPPTGMTMEQVSGLVEWTPPAVGTYDVTVVASDGDLDDAQVFKVVVSPPNDPPVIKSVPGKMATAGIEYTYQLVATDNDGDDMTAELLTGPSSMSMDEDWLVSFIPRPDQVGDHVVTIRVSDGKLHTDQSYTLTVTLEGMNNVPYFVSTPTLTATVGYSYSYRLMAQDDDGHSIDYSLDLAPEGMDLHGDLAEWVPAEDQVGPNDVIARASDRKAYVLQNFTIEVSSLGKNTPPVIFSTPSLSAKVGHTYEYKVEARDDDLDAITYSIDTPFKRMDIDPGTGLLIWHPTSEVTGNQTVRVRASDGKGFDTQEFVVNVASVDKNGLPIYLSTPVSEGKVGSTYNYQPQVQDPDLDTITFSLAERPDGMTIEQTTGMITWVPAPGQEGNWTVEIRASDGKGYGVQIYTITVVPDDVVQAFEVAISRPKDGEKVSGEITVEGTASVAVGELFEVQVRVDNGMWNTAVGLGSWSYGLNTTKLNNGKHTIGTRAWDGNVYSDVVSVEIEVDNKEIEPERKPLKILGLDAAMFFLLLMVLLMVVIGIIMVLRRPSHLPPPPTGRRRREDDGPYGRARNRQAREPRMARARARPYREDDRYSNENKDDHYQDHEDGYDDDHHHDDRAYDQDNHYGPDDGYDEGYEEEYDNGY